VSVPNSSDGNILNDEAAWMAACRARESTRPDRILHDPYASGLLGDTVARFTKTAAGDEFAVGLSTVIVDELLQHAILDRHVHTVVSLMAGLDARPYRLRLPNDLCWIELDREGTLAYKELRLAHLEAACRIERVAIDPVDVKNCYEVLRQVTHNVARGLLLMESTWAYSPGHGLQELADQLPAGLKSWILGGRLPDRRLIDALCAQGWRIGDYRPARDEAALRAQNRIPELGAVVRWGPNSEPGAIWLNRRSATRFALRRRAE
jgi:hypothetical protein